MGCVWVAFWLCLGCIELLWGCVGVALGLCWGNVGVALGLCWGYYLSSTMNRGYIGIVLISEHQHDHNVRYTIPKIKRKPNTHPIQTHASSSVG